MADRDDAGSPASVRTLVYDTGSPGSVHTLAYSDAEDELTPLHYAPERGGAFDRPWMSTRAELLKFQEICRMYARLAGPTAYWKGWDRIERHRAPLQKCKCCGQRLPRQSPGSYVLTEREYMRVDNIFHAATMELNMAAGNVMDRHLGNFYRILTENEAFLQRGLRFVLFHRIKNVIAAVHNLFRQSVPPSDVQTR